MAVNMELNAKTDNFLKAILKYTDEQRQSMHSEINQIKEQKLKEAEAKAKADSEKLIKDKLEEKKNEQTGVLAKKTQDGQKKLFLERAQMTEEVFNRAAEKLIAYTKKSEYSDKLIESAKQISTLFGNKSCVLYVNSRDIQMADKIKANFSGNAEIIADKTIKIGGIKGYCEELSIVADETLDSKLADQREWFIENSNLSVL